jgi:hypothetical protein
VEIGDVHDHFALARAVAGAEAHPEVPHALAHALPRWHVHARVALTATTHTHRRELELLEGAGSVGEPPQQAQPQPQRREPSVLFVSTREEKSAKKVWTLFDKIKPWTPAESLWTHASPLAVSRKDRGDRDEALDRRPSTQLGSRSRRTVDREAPRGITPLQKLEVGKRPERVCKQRASEINGSRKAKSYFFIFLYILLGGGGFRDLRPGA